MRHGMPPIQQALDAGIRPSLSSDVETTMAADMFTQMRAVFTLQRALLNERSIKGEKDLPPLLTARDVIEFATLQGARADGMEAKVGTLTPGKEADIVMLRTRPDQHPAVQQRLWRDRHRDGHQQCRHRLHRRQGGEARRQAGRRRSQPRAPRGGRSRDYLVGKLGWPRSVIDTSLSGH